MLGPQDSSTGGRKRLDGIWSCRLDHDDTGTHVVVRAGGQGYQTYSPETINDATQPGHAQADTMSGLHSLTPQPWSEEYQVDYLDMNHRVFDACDAVVGEQVWNFATKSGIMRVDGNTKGVFARDRRPRSAAFALHRRRRAKG